MINCQTSWTGECQMLLVPKNIEQKGTTFVNFVLCKIGAAYKNCIFGHVCGAVKMLQTHLTQLKHKWTSPKYYIYLHKKNQLHPTLSQNVVFCNIWQFLTLNYRNDYLYCYWCFSANLVSGKILELQVKFQNPKMEQALQ